MNRATLTAAFIALVALPLTGVYLIRSGYYPAAIANGAVIGARSFEMKVRTASQDQGASPLASIRQTVLDQMIERVIVTDANAEQTEGDYGASAGSVIAARRQARVYIFAPDLTWDGERVVAR